MALLRRATTSLVRPRPPAAPGAAAAAATGFALPFPSAAAQFAPPTAAVPHLAALLSTSASAPTTPAAPLRFGIKSDTVPEVSEAVRRVLSMANASNAEVTQAKVARAIEAFASRPGDTGSTPVQGEP